MKTANQEPLFYRGMIASAQSKLVEAGSTPESAVSIARSIVTDYCSKWGGEIIRIPSLSLQEKAERNELIRKDYELMSVAQLCKKYNLSLSVVHGVVQGVVKPSDHAWTEEEVDKLIDQWKEKGTAVEIKGKTRRQIAGKANYMGLGSARRDHSYAGVVDNLRREGL